MTTNRREFLALAGVAALTAGCAGQAARGSRGYNVPVIDAHAHWYPREFVTLLEQEGEANGAKMGRDARGNTVVQSVPGGTQTSVQTGNIVYIVNRAHGLHPTVCWQRRACQCRGKRPVRWMNESVL